MGKSGVRGRGWGRLLWGAVSDVHWPFPLASAAFASCSGRRASFLVSLNVSLISVSCFSVLSQMLKSLNKNRAVGNKSDSWYHCMVPSLQGISAHDSVFIMTWLNQNFFKLFLGCLHWFLFYWAFISDIALFFSPVMMVIWWPFSLSSRLNISFLSFLNMRESKFSDTYTWERPRKTDSLLYLLIITYSRDNSFDQGVFLNVLLDT